MAKGAMRDRYDAYILLKSTHDNYLCTLTIVEGSQPTNESPSQSVMVENVCSIRQRKDIQFM